VHGDVLDAIRDYVESDGSTLLGRLVRALTRWSIYAAPPAGAYPIEDAAIHGVVARLVIAPPSPAEPEQCLMYPMTRAKVERLIVVGQRRSAPA